MATSIIVPEDPRFLRGLASPACVCLYKNKLQVSTSYLVDLIRDGFGEKCCFKVLLIELNSPPPSAIPSSPSSSSMEKDERVVGYVSILSPHGRGELCLWKTCL